MLKLFLKAKQPLPFASLYVIIYLSQEVTRNLSHQKLVGDFGADVVSPSQTTITRERV